MQSETINPFNSIIRFAKFVKGRVILSYDKLILLIDNYTFVRYNERE